MTTPKKPIKRLFERIFTSDRTTAPGPATDETLPSTKAKTSSRRPHMQPPDPDRKQPHGKTEQRQSQKAPAHVPREQSSGWDPAQFKVPEEEGKTRFHAFDLEPQIMHALADLDFRYCTPIQAQILPHCLEGRDAAGQAQTGTGKTAAFLITILQHLLKNPASADRPAGAPRALILAPTRELVIQIEQDAQDVAKHCDVKLGAVFGGMDFNKQKNFLEKNQVDVIAATPGRLLDFDRRNVINLRQVEILVIDEADRMLDMGFIPDIRRIVRATPHKDRRQTLFFSATLTSDVMRLSEQWTRDPVRVEVEPEQVAVDSVGQKVYILTADQKFTLLMNLIRKEHLDRVLVFTNRRDEARKLCDRLGDYGLNTELLSGDVHQKKRLKVLEGFRGGKINVVVATDVAARGLHVEDISHVVNYNLPDNPEDYVHRIGRTGRAGAEGISVSFACEEEGMNLPDIEEFLGGELDYDRPPPELLEPLEDVPKRSRSNHAPPRRRSSGSGRRSSGGGRRPRRR